MKQQDIDRINELARKSKTVGLTDMEKAEQAALRRQFLDDIRSSIRAQVSGIDIVEKDGSITHMSEVVERKEREKEEQNNNE